MAVLSTPASSNEVSSAMEQKEPSEVDNKSTGAEIKSGRISGSEMGKTCHQCRQRTMNFSATCKVMKGVKLCPLRYCYRCLLNRYGEKAQEVELLNDWKCPKCKGICNCSCCMKRRGAKPTGLLSPTAKASGFSSVSEMLNLGSYNNPKGIAVSPKKDGTLNKEVVKNPDDSGTEENVKNDALFPTKLVASNKDSIPIPLPMHGKENSLDGNCDSNFTCEQEKSPAEKMTKKTKRAGLQEICNGNIADDGHKKMSKPKKAKICKETSEMTLRDHKDDPVAAENNNFKNLDGKDVALNENEIEVWKEETSTNEGKCRDTVLNALENNYGETEIIKAKGCQKATNCATKSKNIEHSVDIPLPQGTILTNIFDMDFLSEDIGHALQFLEFCAAFGKALDVRKGEPEAVLRDLIRRQSSRQGQTTVVVQFHIKLLSLIRKDLGKGLPSSTSSEGRYPWLNALLDITSSQPLLKDLQLDSLNGSIDGYYGLDFSTKLQLLNFLCDEALGTEKLRSWIDDQNSKFNEKKKEAKQKFREAKEKEKSLMQKMQNEVAKAIVKNGALTSSEHKTLVSEIENDAAQAHAEKLEHQGILAKRKKTCDVIRTEAEFFDVNGHAFWKLNCCTADHALLRQGIKVSDQVEHADEWFAYGAEHEKDIQMYISSRAKRRKKTPNVASVQNTSVVDSVEES